MTVIRDFLQFTLHDTSLRHYFSFAIVMLEHARARVVYITYFVVNIYPLYI